MRLNKKIEKLFYAILWSCNYIGNIKKHQKTFEVNSIENINNNGSYDEIGKEKLKKLKNISLINKNIKDIKCGTF